MWARYTLFVFYLISLILPLSIIFNYLEYQLLEDIAQGFFPDEQTLKAYRQRNFWVGLLKAVFYLASAVFFLIWFYRTYRNTYYRTGYLKKAPHWAWASFFIPILNCYLPYQLMKEVWVESQKMLLPEEDRREAHRRISYALVQAWWILFLLSYLIILLTEWLSWGAYRLEEKLNVVFLMLTTDFLEIPAVVVTIWLVRQTADFDKELREKRARVSLDS